MSAHQESCARCGVDAVMWSGAFTDAGEPWIGWCSNYCKNAWLDGDKASGSQGYAQTDDNDQGGKG